MSELEQPRREKPVAHQCVCLLLYKGQRPEPGGGFTVVPVPSKCGSMVYDPDSPFCSGCEQGGHHLLPNYGPHGEPAEMES